MRSVSQRHAFRCVFSYAVTKQLNHYRRHKEPATPITWMVAQGEFVQRIKAIEERTDARWAHWWGANVRGHICCHCSLGNLNRDGMEQHLRDA